MPTTDYAALPAGRELDALVAQRVMGLVRSKDFGVWPKHQWQLDEDGEVDMFAYDGDTHNGPRCTLCDKSYCHHCEKPSDVCEAAPPGYSVYLPLAWEVVERLQSRGYAVELFSIVPAGGWRMRVLRDDKERANVIAETAELAICRAALKAVNT